MCHNHIEYKWITIKMCNHIFSLPKFYNVLRSFSGAIRAHWSHAWYIFNSKNQLFSGDVSWVVVTCTLWPNWIITPVGICFKHSAPFHHLTIVHSHCWREPRHRIIMHVLCAAKRKHQDVNHIWNRLKLEVKQVILPITASCIEYALQFVTRMYRLYIRWPWVNHLPPLY